MRGGFWQVNVRTVLCATRRRKHLMWPRLSASTLPKRRRRCVEYTNIRYWLQGSQSYCNTLRSFNFFMSIPVIVRRSCISYGREPFAIVCRAWSKKLRAERISITLRAGPARPTSLAFFVLELVIDQAQSHVLYILFGANDNQKLQCLTLTFFTG